MTNKNEPLFKERSPEELDFHAGAITEVQNIFREKFGIFAFPCFGTLVGVVRDRDFVPHDNDIDMLWIANGKNRSEICRHVLAVYQALREREMFWGLGNAAGQCSVRMQRDMPNGMGKGTTVIDMFAGWVEDGNLWLCQWGNVGQVNLQPARIALRKEEVLIPEGAGEILTYLYGDWLVPSDTHPSKRHVRTSHLLTL